MKSILASGIRDKQHLAAIDIATQMYLSGVPLNKAAVYLIESVDSSALMALASQFNVAGFRGFALATTEAEQRELIREAIELNRRKGTPFAIRRALESVGFTTGVQILENFLLVNGPQQIFYNGVATYNGTSFYTGINGWATFRVLLDVINYPNPLTVDLVNLIIQLINEYRNARSMLVLFTLTVNHRENLTVSDELDLTIFVDVTENILVGPFYNGQFSYNGAAQHSTDNIQIQII